MRANLTGIDGVSPFCPYAAELISEGNDAVETELSSSLETSPCRFINTGKCAAAEFAIKKMFQNDESGAIDG